MFAAFTDYFLTLPTLAVNSLYCAYFLAEVASLLEVSLWLLGLVIIVTDELAYGAGLGRYFDQIFEVRVGREESGWVEVENVFMLVRTQPKVLLNLVRHVKFCLQIFGNYLYYIKLIVRRM